MSDDVRPVPGSWGPGRGAGEPAWVRIPQYVVIRDHAMPSPYADVMKVGVYVDGYNLYYGARDACGRGTAGWRWLDIRSLASEVISKQRSWANTTLERVAYCTARVDGSINPSAQADQDVYLKAILNSGSVDWIEYGNYVARAKKALLATPDPQTKKPVVVASQWPVMVRDSGGVPVRDAQFMVQYLHLEEKGSDVNVATHMLIDVLGGKVDAALVISNDSDLALPIREARARVPVATVNPYKGITAGALQGAKDDGAGQHWWWKISPETYRKCQLANPAGGQHRPIGW